MIIMNKINLKKAYINPSKVFDSPSDVCNSEGLTLEQKKKILDQWEYDAKQLHVAEKENMPGPKLKLLQQVLEAKKQIGVN